MSKYEKKHRRKLFGAILVTGSLYVNALLGTPKLHAINVKRKKMTQANMKKEKNKNGAEIRFFKK